MHGPRTFAVEIDGVQHRIFFEKFDVMTEEEWNNPLVTASVRLETSEKPALTLEYEEWISELGNGTCSRWRTGCSDQWNDVLPDMTSHGVYELRAAIDDAISTRLTGSGWRTHL